MIACLVISDFQHQNISTKCEWPFMMWKRPLSVTVQGWLKQLQPGPQRFSWLTPQLNQIIRSEKRRLIHYFHSQTTTVTEIHTQRELQRQRDGDDAGIYVSTRGALLCKSHRRDTLNCWGDISQPPLTQIWRCFWYCQISKMKCIIVKIMCFF